MPQIQPKPESILSRSPQLSRGRCLLILVVVTALLVVLASADAPVSNALPQLPGALDPLDHNYPAAMQATLVAFGRAVREFSASRFPDALAAMPSDSAAASTAIAGHMMLYRAKALLESGKAKEALNLLRGLPEQRSDSPVIIQGVLDRSRALLALGDPNAALVELSGPPVKDDAEVLFLRGQALEQAGKSSDALRLYLRVISDFLASDLSVLAERRLRLLSPNYLTRAENRDIILRRSENLIRAGRSQEARSLLLKLEGVPVPGPFAERQSLLLADAGTNLTRLTESLQYLRRVTGPAYAAQANYLKGICYRGLGKESALLETRDRALQLYPQSPYTERLLYSVATYYDAAGRAEAAHSAYQALLRAFPKGAYSERSLWRSAMLFYIAGNHEEALGGFRQSFFANPILSAVPASAYWMGRCYVHLGHPAEAALIFRRVQSLANNSYYGQLAREALAKLQPSEAEGPASAAADFARLSQQLDAVHTAADINMQPSPADLRRVERARQLMAAGLPDLALSEIDYGADIASGGNKALCYARARVLESQAKYLDVILTLRRVIPDYIHLPLAALPKNIWDLLFPVRYLNEINKHAIRYGLDPNLVLAIIRQESAFQEDARSPANARGLMQLLPATGRMLARQTGMSQFTVTKLYQAEANIALGTKYLAERLQKYGGREELALAAYNAGDNRVDRWLQEFGGTDMAEFVERIPFSETRGYVKQVLTNKTHYHLRTAMSPAQQSP